MNELIIILLSMLGIWCFYHGFEGFKKYKQGYGLIIHTMSIEETRKTSNPILRLALISVSLIYIILGVITVMLSFNLLYHAKS